MNQFCFEDLQAQWHIASEPTLDDRGSVRKTLCRALVAIGTLAHEDSMLRGVAADLGVPDQVHRVT